MCLFVFGEIGIMMSSQSSPSLSFPIITNALLAWILILPLLPFIFSTLVLLTLYKVVVLILARFFKSGDLLEPVTGLDISFSTDSFYEKPYGALAFIHVVEGKLSPELVIDRFKKVFEQNKGTSSSGYEKLTSVYPVFWMGHLFWKKANKQFDVKNHIKVNTKKDFPNSTRFDELNKLLCEWMQEPFVLGLPLWEIRIIPEITLVEDEIGSSLNHSVLPQTSFHQSSSTLKLHVHQTNSQCGNSSESIIKKSEVKSIFVLKTHHVIGDGNSMLRLLENIFDADSNGQKPRKDEVNCSRLVCEMQNSKSTTPFASTSSKSYSFEMREVNGQESLGKGEMSEKKQEHQEGIIVKMDDSVRKVEHTTTFTSEREKNADPRKFSLFAKSFKSGIIKLWIKSRTCITGVSQSKREENVEKEAFLYELSHRILLVFLTPLSLFILVKAFAIHRDCWFTKRKESNKLNLTTTCISMKWLNLIRKDLCESYLRPNPEDAFGRTETTENFSLHNTTSNNGILKGNKNSGKEQEYAKKLCSDKHFPSKLGPVPLVIIAISAFAGALGRWARKINEKGSAGASDDKREPEVVPSSANYVVALPLRRKHPGATKFCNFWTHGILKVKMSELNSLRRLRSLNYFYMKIRSYQSPEICHSLVRFHSLLPQSILRAIANYNMGASIGVTNLAGSPIPVYIGGQRVLQQFPYFGLQWRHASMTLALFSYNGMMNATVLANESVIPSQKDVMEIVNEHFMEELQSFYPKFYSDNVSHL